VIHPLIWHHQSSTPRMLLRRSHPSPVPIGTDRVTSLN
jgi:hypothetical protein